jgi:hypothetical protein
MIACVPITSCAVPSAAASIAARFSLVFSVLLGEDFGRRHQRGLVAGVDGLCGGQRGDDCLAAADVALQQPLHRMRLRQIERDLTAHALLRRRQRKRQRLQQTRHQRGFVAQFAARHGRRRARAALFVRALQRHLLREQFLELDAHPRRMRAVDQRGLIGLHVRMMQRAHRVHQRRHAERLHVRARDRLRQQFRQRGARQRVVDRFAQIRLRDARGARVHRRQRLRQRRVFIDDAHRRNRRARRRAPAAARRSPSA